MTDKNRGKYDDILYMTRPASKHPKIPLSDRAAQFAPFAALTGHGDAVKETARLTDEYTEPDEGQKEHLDQRLKLLLAAISGKSGLETEVTATYFKPDEKKDGGAYVSVKGSVKKVDGHLRQIILADGTALPMDYIISMDGAVFDAIDKSQL